MISVFRCHKSTHHWETDIITAYEMRSMSQVLVNTFKVCKKYDLSDRSIFWEILLKQSSFYFDLFEYESMDGSVMLM